MSGHEQGDKPKVRTRNTKKRRVLMEDRNRDRDSIPLQALLDGSDVPFLPPFDATGTPIQSGFNREHGLAGDQHPLEPPSFPPWTDDESDNQNNDFLEHHTPSPVHGGIFADEQSQGQADMSMVGYRPVTEFERPPPRPVGGRRRNKGGQFARSSDGSCNFDEAESSRGGKNNNKKNADVSWIVTGPMGGGPEDGSVIPSYGGHVAADIWRGTDRGVMRLHGRASMCQSLSICFSRCMPSVQARVRATALSHLPALMFKHLDAPLLSAFIERWQPDTNTFHMPFGEMTILLHDVKCILDIPVAGDVVASDWSSDYLQERCAELLGKDMESFEREEWNGGNLDSGRLLEACVRDTQSENYQFVCYMLMVLSATLFVDKSGGKVRGQTLPVIKDGMSWGSATLAYLYHQLGIGSRAQSRGLAGCCTLLQAWIYEYFPIFRPTGPMGTNTVTGPRAYRWKSRERFGRDLGRLHEIRQQLDALQPHEVEWMPFGSDVVRTEQMTHYRGLIRYFDIIEPYMPDRVVRQLGYVQGVPDLAVIAPDRVLRPANPSLYSVPFSVNFQKQLWIMTPWWYTPDVRRYVVATIASECSPDYLQWFIRCSHPIIVNQDRARPTSDAHDHEMMILSNMMQELEPFVHRPLSAIPTPDLESLMSTMTDYYDEYKQGQASGTSR